MKKAIELIFDFGSPNAYLAYRALPPILARTGARLVLTPCLLGGIFKLTGNKAPMFAFSDVQGKLTYEMLEMRRFIAREKISKFSMNPYFPINTLTLMRALVAAGSFVFILISRTGFLREIRYAAVILVAGTIVYCVRSWRRREWPFGKTATG